MRLPFGQSLTAPPRGALTTAGRRQEMVLAVSPGNALWRHRSAIGRTRNERTTRVLHKPDKLISYRHSGNVGTSRLRNRRNEPSHRLKHWTDPG
jgi:hypothetical protein